MSDDKFKAIADTAVRLHQVLTSVAKRGEWRSVSQDPPTMFDVGPAELQLLGKDVSGNISVGVSGNVVFTNSNRRHVDWRDYEFWRST